jgi:hypothetical protein
VFSMQPTPSQNANGLRERATACYEKANVCLTLAH